MAILINEGSINTDLIDILQILNLKHNFTASSINEIMQENFLRNNTTERYQLNDNEYSTIIRASLLTCFERLGMITEILPKGNKYKHILILGANRTLKNRIDFFIRLLSLGYQFERIFFLTGKREVSINEKNNMLTAYNITLPTTIHTEDEEAKFLCDTVYLSNLIDNITFVISPKAQEHATGKLKRPTTYDSVMSWLQMNPEIGTCLAISNNPYIHYQQTVLKNIFNHEKINMSIETVGAGSKENNIALYLDTLARQFYEENIGTGS